MPGALVGLGTALLLLQLAPRVMLADDALTRLGDLTATPAATVSTRIDRAGSWVSRRMPNIRGFAAPTKELDLLEIPVSTFYARKLQLAAIGFIGPLLLPIVFQLTLGFFFPLPLLLSPVLALVMWLWPDATVRAKARQARREFTRFVTVYLELVAVTLLGTTTPDSALSKAASLSDAWAFRRIRREYQIAELTRVSKWDALDRLGEQLDVPALTDMARMMRLGEARVGLRDQLRAACDKLRAKVAADDFDAAERATSAMTAPVVATLVPILALVLVPFLLQLTTL
ncbi:hypothetical protein [Clavibacter nebraskensis]|uniref:hypothetical protein n=1 Tax=Clavibacter nebraskensis TaxID=31963 RepID=UPI003F4B81A3